MAKPTDIELFATDATFAADGDAWSGDPVRVDPGVARREEGFEPDTLPAEWLNHQLGLLGDHVDYIHGILEADGSESLPAVTRTVCLSGNAGTPDRAGGADNWRGAGQASLISNGANAPNWVSFFLNKILPEGAIVTRVRAMVLPGAVRAAEADRMFLEIERIDYDFGAATDGAAILFAPSGGTGRDDGTTAQQTMSTGTISITLATKSEDDYVLRVYSGSTAGNDEILALELQFTDPGPRNF